MLVDVLTLAPAVAVVVAVVLGVLTLRQWQRTRYLTAAAELVHTMQSAEFSAGIARIVELPEDAEPTRITGDPELLRSFYAVSHVFESLGVLVYHRMLPLHLVDHLIGGYVRASWRRVRPTVLARRQSLGAMFGEWFQWLAERMEAYPAKGKQEGAWNAFRDWRP